MHVRNLLKQQKRDSGFMQYCLTLYNGYENFGILCAICQRNSLSVIISNGNSKYET